MSATTEVATHEQLASAEQSLVEREQEQSLGAMDGLDLLLLLALLPLHWSLFFLVVAQWFVRRNPRLLAGLLRSAGAEGLARSSAAAEYLPGLRQLQQEQQVVRPAVRPAAPADDALLTGLLTRAAPSASASASSTVTIAAAPVPWRTWRIWAVTAHHLLIIGNTNSGKTTLVRALLPGKRGTILVIDPKNRPGKWGSITAIGLDDDAEYIQIEQALQMVLAELRQRQRALNQGQTDFPPLTVVVDEAPDVADECATFPTLFKRVGSIGRELHISLMALSQRSTVKSLGIIGDGQARDNFTKILMGSFARRAVPALEGQTHGAVLDRDGKQSVLDVAPLPTYARLPVEHAVAWPFPGLLHDDEQRDEETRAAEDSDSDAPRWLTQAIGTGSEASGYAEHRPDGARSEPGAEPGFTRLPDPGEISEEQGLIWMMRQGASVNSLLAVLGGNKQAARERIRHLAIRHNLMEKYR